MAENGHVAPREEARRADTQFEGRTTREDYHLAASAIGKAFAFLLFEPSTDRLIHQWRCRVYVSTRTYTIYSARLRMLFRDRHPIYIARDPG